MDSLNNHIREYQIQLGQGQIQKAYRGIMTFMAGLSAYLEHRHPDYTVSALYPGYLDMTYFAFTPTALRDRKLKIAIVYLHERGVFEVWLAGNNRKVQAEYSERLSRKNTGQYQLSQVLPGVDSIIESLLVEKPDFAQPEELRREIERKTIEFVNDMASLLREEGER